MSKFQIFRRLLTYVNIKQLRFFFESIKYYSIGLWKRIELDHLFLSAGGIAFSLILSMIPFILVVFALIGSLVPIELIQKQLNIYIDTIIPYAEYANYTKEMIMKRIPDVFEYKTTAGYLGIFGLLFTSTWLFSSMRTILNSIFGVSKERGALYGLIRDFGMVFLLILFVAISLIVFPVIDLLKTSTLENEFLILLRINGLFQFIFSFLSIVLIYLMFFGLYYFIPYEKLGKKIPAISAAWATFLWETMRYVFGYYVTTFLSTNKFYGAFLLLLVIGFWIFYSSALFIVGAQIGQLVRAKNEIKNII